MKKEAYLRRYEVNSKLYEQLPAYKKFFRKKKETVNLGGPKKKNNKKLEDNDDEISSEDAQHNQEEMYEIAIGEKNSDVENTMKGSVKQEKSNDVEKDKTEK